MPFDGASSKMKLGVNRMFTDFNEERQAKFDELINRSLNPHTFFR